MNPAELHSYLNSFTNFESRLHNLKAEDFNLNRIEKFLDLAGDPARNLKVIHVAGTKGKGSTCAFLASILQEAGFKVGLYTSPHLHRVNERIRISNVEISDEELASILTTLRPFAAAIQNEGNILTYFEVLTVAALCYFAKAQVDVVILETGLGGRLDATNAVNSMVAVITPISLDHTRILGPTLGKIASEKAGIIKNSHQKVVIAPQETEVMDVLFKRCKEFGVHPVIVNHQGHENLKIGLRGRHQLVNAATSIEVVSILRILGFEIGDEAIATGLKNVHWPGRFELLSKNPDIIVDCAHNDASSKALSQTLKEEYPNRQVILVLGVSQDKDVAAICQHLKDNVAHIFLTQAQHPRSHQFTEVEGKNYFEGKPFEIIDTLSHAIEKAQQIADPRDVILVTGSIFVVAEAIECINTKV